MTIHEYINLKKQYSSVKHKLGKLNDHSLHYTSYVNRFYELQEILEDVEQNDREISEYVELKKLISDLKRKIGPLKYWGKDSSAEEAQLAEAQEKFNKYETTTKKHNETQIKSAPPSYVIKDSGDVVVSEPSEDNKSIYYNINLAWYKEERKIIDCVKGFIDRSNYIKFDSSPNTMTWKFSYDTVEEKAVVKALLVGASHMIDVLASVFGTDTDVEIFGKIQNY